jgi:RHS repeat-associated protein
VGSGLFRRARARGMVTGVAAGLLATTLTAGILADPAYAASGAPATGGGAASAGAGLSGSAAPASPSAAGPAAPSATGPGGASGGGPPLSAHGALSAAPGVIKALPVAITAAGKAVAEARALGHAVVVAGSTTSRDQTLANPNGTFTARLAAGPVRVKGRSGWESIDPALTTVAGHIAPKATLGGLSLSGGGSGPIARLHAQGQRLSVSLAGAGSLPAPKVSGSTATYPGVLAGVDLQMRSLAAGIDARLVLRHRPSTARSYSFRLQLGSLRLVKGPGSTIVLETGAGKPIGSSPGPVMWGATTGAHSGLPTHQTPVPLSISRSGSTTTLTVTPPASFLADPAVAYPVTIDPALTLSDVGDSYVDSGYATANYGSATGLHVGTYDSQANADRALLAFSTSGLPAGAHVSSATLNAFEYWSWSCTPEAVSVSPITGSWNASSVTWDNQPPTGAAISSQTVAHGYSASCPSAWVGFDVTSAVQSWANGGANDGLEITTNESNDYYWKKFTSTNAGSNAPYISVTYTTTPSVPAAPGFSPDHSGEAEALTPSFSAGYSNPDGSSGYDAFRVLDSAGAVVASGNGTTVASGGTSTWALPAPGLTVGQSYTVEAQAVSGGYTSAWSSPTSLRVDPRLAWGIHPWQTNVALSPSHWSTARVDVANGEMSIAQPLFSLPGVGIGLNLSLYNTASPGTGSTPDPGKIAFDWLDSLSGRLAANGDGSVTYYRPSGGAATFTSTGSGGYNTPGSIAATLSGSTSAGWTLEFHTAGTNHAQGQTDTFNTSGQLTKQTAATGQAINVSYTNGEPTKVTDTTGRVIDLSYNSSGQLTKVTDTATGHTWSLGYTNGFLASVTDPAGGVTTFTNNSSGQVTTIATPGGRKLDIAYNSAGQVSSLAQVDPGASSNPTWGFSYGSGTTTATDPDGNKTTYNWDNAARVTKTTDALGQSRSTTWTSDNNVAKLTDTAGNVTSFTWNATTDVLEKQTLPTGATTTYTYGDSSNPYVPTKVTDAQGNSVTYAYDSYGQVTKTTDGLSSQNSATATYQGVSGASCGAKTGQVCSTTNPTGATTTYGYNSAGQVTKVTPPSPLGPTSYAYDADGQPTSVTDGRADTTTYTWNSLGELTKAAPASGTATTYAYDSDGNLTERSGAAGSQAFTWDPLGRLASSTGLAGHVTTYSYDPAGNPTKVSGPAGTSTYTYNSVNQPTTVVDPWGGTTKFTYATGNDTELPKVAFPNGVSESFGYDNSGRVTSLAAKNPSGSTLLSHTYSYTNPSGGADTALVQSRTDTAGDTTAYAYDAADRLSAAKTTTPSGSTVSSYAYGYDGAGNRTSRTANGTTTTYAYNSASQLTTQGAAYDPAGNLTAGAGLSTAGYNPAGQTTSVTPTGGSAASLSYVGNTQDQLASAGGTTIATNALGIASTTTSGTSTDYAYTPLGGLLAEHAGGHTYYYLLGRLGSVLGLTDHTGALVDHYTYTPYGQQTTLKTSVANLFGYDGGLQVPGTPLVHYGARYYNPSVAQWTQLDPSGKNPGYVYAGDSPTNYVDITGLCGGFFSCITSAYNTVNNAVNSAARFVFGSTCVANYGMVGIVGGATLTFTPLAPAYAAAAGTALALGTTAAGTQLC